MRITADIRNLDADRARVVADRVIGDARIGDEAIDGAIGIDVVVAAIAGLVGSPGTELEFAL